MKLLRDIRLSTKLLIMLEILDNPGTAQRPVAQKLGMTVQGVSEYIHLMEKECLIARKAGKITLTQAGVQSLHASISELREFVVSALQKVDIIRSCGAIAGSRIRKGETVGLFMEGGVLVAYAGRLSSSKGRSLADAKKGEDIAVAALEGVVGLQPGKITLLELHSATGEPFRRAAAASVKKAVAGVRHDKAGALDPAGVWALAQSGARCDFEFSAVPSAIDAAQKGLHILLAGSREETAIAAKLLQEHNSRAAVRLNFEIIRVA